MYRAVNSETRGMKIATIAVKRKCTGARSRHGAA